jgi:hypothetical protein
VPNICPNLGFKLYNKIFMLIMLILVDFAHYWGSGALDLRPDLGEVGI